ncbi:MerR family transcriptional regulator [Nonomuraea glycinis]|uniref:MerR family transcriptional regulator n=1 Tax=Nonomuraea glycinis TaxID=2047744 RepID=UPI001CD96B5E|nr:MerR family transcriptional regulator [Nonomuraea glycinis]MCA2179327.1 MerR family transcriptional regulator [Nonomuraea glycinis]
MDDNELYPIGDVARRTGLSVSAIRFYADAEVIVPTGHTDAGYRLYDIQAIARLELVRTLRELGASLDDIRRLLADETTLHDLATAHLALVERQTRRLQARRAVLRTIVKQHTATEQVSLMHKLVSMSDDDRNRLIDEFWDEVTTDLNVHPSFAEQLHRMRPNLPEEPATEQLEAWIELADLVQDGDFRQEVRQFLHNSFSAGSKALEMTSPETMARIEQHRLVEVEVATAQQSGLPVDSPEARELVDRLVASTAEFTAHVAGECDVDELRRQMATPDRTSAAHQHAEQFVTQFSGLFDRYVSLMATIDGTPQPDPGDVAETEDWIAAVLTADSGQPASGT